MFWAWRNSVEWMNATGCGAHIFSADGYSWTVSRTPVYDVGVELYNGSKATFQTRQRPQILFTPDGACDFNSIALFCKVYAYLGSPGLLSSLILLRWCT